MQITSLAVSEAAGAPAAAADDDTAVDNGDGDDDEGKAAMGVAFTTHATTSNNRHVN